jgi:hypothetical protein
MPGYPGLDAQVRAGGETRDWRFARLLARTGVAPCSGDSEGVGARNVLAAMSGGPMSYCAAEAAVAPKTHTAEAARFGSTHVLLWATSSRWQPVRAANRIVRGAPRPNFNYRMLTVLRTTRPPRCVVST